MIDQANLRYLRKDVILTGVILSMMANIIKLNPKLDEWKLYFVLKDILFSAGTRVKNGAMLEMLFKCV